RTAFRILHSSGGESKETTATSCLEAYAELGVSDHSPEVEEAQEMLNEAQRRGGVITPKLGGPLAAAGRPSTASVTASSAIPVLGRQAGGLAARRRPRRGGGGPGRGGHCCADEWVERHRALAAGGDGGGADDGDWKGTPTTFRQALEALPGDCHRRRLVGALEALASTPDAPALSVRQAAGLVRGSALLSSEGSDRDDDGGGATTGELQARAVSHLVRSVPRLASWGPCGIFLAVQLPLLRTLPWDAFVGGGIRFPSGADESEFRDLLDADFEGPDEGPRAARPGEKRQRTEAGEDGRAARAPSALSHVLEAAHLARKGAVRAQHGAVICDGGRVIGRGWNHDFVLDRAASNKNKIVLHSEVHAVADAIERHGEDACFDELFPRSTIVIAELESDYAYETCHPCPKCDPLLRAVGIGSVLHTTPRGGLERVHMGPSNLDLLSRDNVAIPLMAALNEKNVVCERLQRAAPTIRVPGRGRCEKC
ncbi:hypothetical protein ACHAWF_011120, partial [Thalassiosira exigua]